MEYLQELLQAGFKGEDAFNKLQVRYRELVREKERYRLRLNLLERAIHQDYDSIMIITPGRNPSDQKIVYVNDAFCTMTGYSPEEVSGESPQLLWGESTDATVLDHQQERMKMGCSFHGETVGYRKDRSTFTLRWDIHPLFNEDDKLTHWVAYQSDISNTGDTSRGANVSLEEMQNWFADVVTDGDFIDGDGGGDYGNSVDSKEGSTDRKGNFENSEKKGDFMDAERNSMNGKGDDGNSMDSKEGSMKRKTNSINSEEESIKTNKASEDFIGVNTEELYDFLYLMGIEKPCLLTNQDVNKENRSRHIGSQQTGMNIQEKQDRLIRQFELLGDWTERYKYIIKLGQKLDPLDESKKVDENLVRGCQSQVWLDAQLDGDKVIFKADSDAAITKGLVAMMVQFYTDETPDTILQTEPEFIKKIGMQDHLSPTRSNGLASMVRQMKIYAMAYKTKLSV